MKHKYYSDIHGGAGSICTAVVSLSYEVSLMTKVNCILDRRVIIPRVYVCVCSDILIIANFSALRSGLLLVSFWHNFLPLLLSDHLHRSEDYVTVGMCALKERDKEREREGGVGGREAERERDRQRQRQRDNTLLISGHLPNRF